MSAEKISYNLKRFSGIKRDILPKRLKDLGAQLKSNIQFVNNNQQSFGNY